MRAYGITYDTGFMSAGTTTHEPFDPDAVRRDMRVIRDELHCDAVRITGGVADRLEIAARHAADAGLEVWYSPFTHGLTQDELLEFLVDAAGRAERLRRIGAAVVFLTGSELSLVTDGFVPGGSLPERLGNLRTGMAEVPARINAFLARAVPAVRARFGGPVSYASLPFERVDWAPFDIIATDAGYRDAGNAATFRAGLPALVGQGKPFAVTEFGCTTYRGAAGRGGRGDAILEWDERARPARLTEDVVRDEAEQAQYLREVLAVYDEEGVDAVFVNTFANRDRPCSDDDPDRDFDKASYGIVKVLPSGEWAPKEAFHALAGELLNRSARRAPA